MKAARRLILVYLCLLLMIMLGCSEEVVPKGPEYYRVFTGQNKKTWKITKLVWTGEGKSDVTINFSNCFKDDLYIFYADKDNQYEVIGGTNKCDTNESNLLVSNSWSFVNASATLSIIIPLFSNNSLPFIATKVSKSEMTLEIYLDQNNTYSYQITMQSVSEE